MGRTQSQSKGRTHTQWEPGDRRCLGPAFLVKAGRSASGCPRSLEGQKDPRGGARHGRGSGAVIVYFGSVTKYSRDGILVRSPYQSNRSRIICRRKSIGLSYPPVNGWSLGGCLSVKGNNKESFLLSPPGQQSEWKFKRRIMDLHVKNATIGKNANIFPPARWTAAILSPPPCVWGGGVPII